MQCIICPFPRGCVQNGFRRIMALTRIPRAVVDPYIAYRGPRCPVDSLAGDWSHADTNGLFAKFGGIFGCILTHSSQKPQFSTWASGSRYQCPHNFRGTQKKKKTCSFESVPLTLCLIFATPHHFYKWCVTVQKNKQTNVICKIILKNHKSWIFNRNLKNVWIVSAWIYRVNFWDSKHV